MIICPNCKEEIEDNSHYCDQCGQALLYCNQCGRVGMGRRCTSCGGLMVTAEERANGARAQMSVSESVSARYTSQRMGGAISPTTGGVAAGRSPHGIPMLTLSNPMLNIRIDGINGAVIGRKQGPYVQYFQQNMFVSGVHAQLKYKAGTGWCIIDKHSSNGTKLNDRAIQPDTDMTLKNGDIVTIANVNLQVTVS
jgi:hypothetical protein